MFGPWVFNSGGTENSTEASLAKCLAKKGIETGHWQTLPVDRTFEIVELLGGNISVEGEFEKGSNFIVVLPLVNEQGPNNSHHS